MITKKSTINSISCRVFMSEKMKTNYFEISIVLCSLQLSVSTVLLFTAPVAAQVILRHRCFSVFVRRADITSLTCLHPFSYPTARLCSGRSLCLTDPSAWRSSRRPSRRHQCCTAECSCRTAGPPAHWICQAVVSHHYGQHSKWIKHKQR